MRVAIVGAADSVDKIYNILEKKYIDIEFVLKKEDKIEKIHEVLEEIKDEVDGIYLTGIGVYYSLVNNSKFDLEKPVVYTRRGSIGLIKSFWELKEEKNNILNLKLGIDIVEEEILLNVLKEFDIKLEKIFYQKYEMLKKEEEYIEEYLKAYKNGEINCVFTSFGYIYNVLKEKKIPVYRIQATNIEIENEFKALLNRIELVNNRKGKIGIEIIKLESLNMNLDNNLENKMKIEKKLLEYAKELEGNIQTSDKKEYIIISNIEVLKNTENLKRIFSLQNELELLEEKIVVGIGEGNTIFQAEKNARISLKLSLNKNGKIFYSNGEKIKGPLYSSKELEYKKVSSKRMKKIADEIGINSSYLEKIKGIMCKKKKDEFTSSEIAEILNITQRSTNRILKKIIEKDYAESVQVENSVGVGRPKRIIKFKIN